MLLTPAAKANGQPVQRSLGLESWVLQFKFAQGWSRPRTKNKTVIWTFVMT